LAANSAASGRRNSPQTSRGDYWVGVDLGKRHDYSVVAVVRKDGDIFRLVGLKIFPLGTDYTGEAGVVGFVRVLTQKLQTIHRILIDQTGVGESVVEEARKSLPNAEGIVLSAPVKQDIMNYLKIMMQQKRLLIPYQLELANELNIERFQLTKAGQVQFSHPDGTHDDRVWGIALAVFATRTRPVPQFKPITRAF
jgi:phage FluMu gp28-like protein